MKKSVESKLESILPSNKTKICYGTYLPFATESIRENDAENNTKRIGMYKLLNCVYLDPKTQKFKQDFSGTVNVGRGKLFGFKLLLDNLFEKLDPSNYKKIGTRLYLDGYISEKQLQEYLKNSSDLFDTEALTDIEIKSFIDNLSTTNEA